MKRVFFAADAAQPAAGGASATPAPERVFDSPKLTELRATYAKQWADMVKSKEGSKEALDLMLETYKTQKQIEGEIAGIKNHEAELERQELRNKRVKMVDDLLDAKVAELDGQSQLDKIAVGKRTPEQIEAQNALSNKVKDLRENIANELLAKYGGVTKAATTGTTTGTKGGTSAEILEYIVANYPATPFATINKDLQAKGFSRGTVGSVITQYKKDNNIA